MLEEKESNVTDKDLQREDEEVKSTGWTQGVEGWITWTEIENYSKLVCVLFGCSIDNCLYN